MAKPHPPPHTSLHPSPAAAAAAGGSLTGTGPSSGERCGDTPGRYPHISTTRSLFPAPCAQPGPPPSSSISSSPPPPPPPPRPFISSGGPGLSESTADFDRWEPGRGQRSKQARRWCWLRRDGQAAAATCFSEREAESREVWGRISFFGAGAPHRTPTWLVPDTWHVLGRWIGTGIRGQEAAGRFWKSETQRVCGRTCRP